MPRELSKLTAAELKDKLRTRGLPTSGSKTELLMRLHEVNPSDSGEENSEDDDAIDEPRQAQENVLRRGAVENMSQREIKLYKREKELAERELDLARREITLLRGQLAGRENPAGGAIEMALNGKETPRVRPQASLTTVADLLSDFDGAFTSFDTWKKQLMFLKTTYRLDDDCAKLLIGMRLKKRAFEWFHSKPEYVEMSFERLLETLGAMFRPRENRVLLRKRFENRVWKKEETFQEYLHEKTIMGNRVPIEEDELLEYIVEGKPDAAMRNQARIQGFTTVDSLVRAFEKVSLRDHNTTSMNRHAGDKSAVDKKRKDLADAKRYFNCGEREHISINCSTKALGAKCFECGTRGHISIKCPKKKNAEKPTVASVSQTSRKKYTQEVALNGQVMMALIDTGSDISIIRASKHAVIGLPKIQITDTKFYGIGGSSARIIGEFQTNILINKNVYPIFLRVAPDTAMPYDLLIGADFIDTVDMSLRGGMISINPIREKTTNDETRPEIFLINVHDQGSNADIDVSLILKHQDTVTNMISEYKPNKTHEIDVKMTIILKDDEPVYQKARRLSQYEKDIVNAQVDEWKKEGIIRESISDFASPVVLVKKKNGSHRLCVDYRMLNKKIIKDRYPLPLIENQIDRLQNARVFSTIDLKN